MMKIKKIAVVILLTTLVGCSAMNSSKSQQPLTHDQLMQAISQILENESAHGTEKTVEELTRLAYNNPASGLPWSYVAKLRFEREQYGPAIVAADEALQRDPDDFVAKSVRVIGGLRVALKSLADIKDNALLANNARVDAQALAGAMRDALGQNVLFPEKKRPVKRKPQAPKAAEQPAAASAPQQQDTENSVTAPVSNQQQPSAATAETERNPFVNLMNAVSQ